ncbi:MULTISPECIES: hypothetical protein [Saccharothrix]|uniref:hypothetical protein n=1 Tax=Saccharothrix TaxID=2071 RepID=UPI00093C4238|nr:hypothetical protein [Saccharothrix sp. CB00851]OKI33337.1 hypothetical protein A6A25_06080 [Saccharothrix sp. CB00851]
MTNHNDGHPVTFDDLIRTHGNLKIDIDANGRGHIVDPGIRLSDDFVAYPIEYTGPRPDETTD